jgi:hypothetical protein
MNLAGETLVTVEPNSTFYLTIYTNNTNGYLYWANDVNFTDLISYGANQTISLNSSLYTSGDTIYVCYFNGGVYGTQLTNILPITININTDLYPIIQERFPYTLTYENPVNIDAIYFKYHKCFSGVCYSYVRDINNIYQENELDSDYAYTGSLNLYNEFDIVDEFFGNLHEAEVAYGANIDIAKKYQNLDNVFLHNGTRILLFGQKNTKENGIYIIQPNFSLIKTDELSTTDKIFRYKVNINAGTYLDTEFHVNGYYTA